MTKTPSESFDRYDVVAVPFPFTDRRLQKRRPAVVLSRAESLGDRIGHSVMAMVTSAKNSPWPLDSEISDLQTAGLPAPSVVRMKLFTLDHRLVDRKLGHLSGSDASRVSHAVKHALGLL